MQNKEYRKKFLFIDDSYVVKVDNLRRKTNQAIKHPEMVIKLDAPWNGPKDELGYVNVVYDSQEKLFKMWYMVSNRVVKDWGSAFNMLAYATSTDGIHWERPVLNMVELNGSKENNYFIGPELEDFVASILIDPSEPAVRRFKMIFEASNIYDSGRVADWAKHHVCLNLAYSEDGLSWDRPRNVNPILRGVSDCVFMFFYDIDRKKYQLFTRRVPNLPRDISLYESFDLVNWEDCGRVFVAGDQLDPPTLYNIHQATVFQYDIYKLALVDTMYLHPISEDLGVFQSPPAGYLYKDQIGIIEPQLGFSIDGRNWHRTSGRSAVISAETGNLHSNGMIFPQINSPIVFNGDTYIFYSSWPYKHTAWSQAEVFKKADRDMRELGCGMLAIMPEDHWVSFDADNEEGSLLAGPWRQLPKQLFVNADAEAGSLEIEFLDAYERPLPGMSRADCVPITANGKDQQVKWKKVACPAKVEGDWRGGVMARIYLRNAKLYSCTFLYDDPDGVMRRYWANYRWNENIFHRSDQWGCSSNAPAGGLPPVTRGMLNY